MRLGFKRRGNETVLDDLYQCGSGKARLVRREANRLKEAVIINTTGGLTDGDRFETSIRWENDTAAIVSTQAAERIYRSRGDRAVISTNLAIGDGACGMWLPQETILFNGARLARKNRVELTGNARLIAIEACIFGRAAMGERISDGFLRDGWQIRQDGKLIFADSFSLEGDIQAKLDRPAIAGGATAIATILSVAPATDKNATGICDDIRRISENCPVAIGCSTLADCGSARALTISRLFAKNARNLRLSIIPVVEMLMARDNMEICASPLPRVWSI